MTSVGDDRWPTAGDVAERPGAPPQETDELFSGESVAALAGVTK